MTGKMTALVHGSGFAGKGHAEAFRDSGVEIVGMVSRTREVVDSVAAEMSIPYSGTDWDAALTELRPDIVAIGTPGGAHYEPLLSAIDAGCHIFCDKPLASYAKEARKVWESADKAGVKTAFAASFCYQPHALWAQELVEQGAIGVPLETEFVSHYNLNPLIPFGWSHRIDLGGGRLNNNFTHKLSIALRVLGGNLERVSGDTRNDMKVAPVVEGIHDFRVRGQYVPDTEEDDDLTWNEVDAEWSYTVMASISPREQGADKVSALFRHGGMHPRFKEDSIDFFGSEGAIHINGAYAQGPLFTKERKSDWKKMDVPKHITESLPRIEDDTQRNWTQLAREFVADIRGEGTSGYQTFRDGWIFQEAIDAVRASSGWAEMPK